MINNETSNELLKVVDDEDDIFNIKRVDHGLDDTNEPIRILNKRQLQKQKEKELKKIASNSKRIEFDDEGNPIKYELESLGEYEKRFGDLSKIQQEHVALHSELMNVADIKDKLTQKNLLRERKRERRNREKEIRRIESGGDVGVSLGHGNDENSGDDEIESHISIRDDSADESNQDNELDMNEDDDTVPSELLSPENLKRSIPSSQLKTLKKRRIDNGNLQTLEEIAMSLIN